jgi:hypothetical protein
MWFSGFLRFRLTVEEYLWWKLQTSAYFISGKTCKIGSASNTCSPYCIVTTIIHQTVTEDLHCTQQGEVSPAGAWTSPCSPRRRPGHRGCWRRCGGLSSAPGWGTCPGRPVYRQAGGWRPGWGSPSAPRGWPGLQGTEDRVSMRRIMKKYSCDST